ncbi:styrene monooxygenase subunit StyA [Amycolatopsis alkalitolerans]|uniref:Monooxygenase n=1 Tax=Amycolatopsis alkalitolerans TaxID=2547244 RepID=A0A5C4LWU1_9PSEU|nr:styrene monooxygenase/indole monooxygenase family protein [Amycolatopsis alkalitolerans]TNC22707.1 monooxygenase [Amycolatopsis alkalitolerans]
MAGIGIVGAGVAGLHLGLLLRQHEVPVTIYSDRTARQLGSGRMLNSVAHHHATIERERALGVDHWEAEEYHYFGHHHYLGGGPQPLVFPGFFTAPSRAIDYRLYLPALLEDFVSRGGEFDVRPVQAADVVTLSERHDLVVIASGRGDMSAMFPRRADKSPYDAPQRKLCVGLYEGVAPSDPRGVTMSVAAGHGELLEIPIYSSAGHVTALLFENVPGGDLEMLAEISYEDDPAGFEKTILDKTRQYHPATFARIDPAAFHLTGPLDVLQGAVLPSVREDYTRLPNGRYVVAVGDAHVVVDPVIGQGANCASYSAWELGHAIVEDPNFDERFCRKVADRRRNRVYATADWTNLMIRTPPPPHLLRMFGAMAQNQAVADEFTENFSYPDRQWDNLATPERVQHYLTARGLS